MARVSWDALSDSSLHVLIERYQKLTKDEAAIRCITFLVALVVCSRSASPEADVMERYGIAISDSANLIEALRQYVPEDSASRRAVESVVARVGGQHEAALFAVDNWEPWRQFDGPAFCDLARQFFSAFSFESMKEVAPVTIPEERLSRFAWEASLITRSFSARWFNACARFEAPAPGAIRWYLGHCLGKLELELEREQSDWIEPLGNPWKRKRKQHNARLL